MGPEEYRQMTTYLAGEYGNAGFIITRDDSENLLSDRELPWMREIYNRQKKLVVKLTGSFLRRILSKLRSPQRHDEAESAVEQAVRRLHAELSRGADTPRQETQEEEGLGSPVGATVWCG
jgi:hypothetical protein